jgi:toxin ParE1/3/4
VKQVRFTAQAELDLEEIGDYIAADNPSRALAFVQAIREHCKRIAAAPSGYPRTRSLAKTFAPARMAATGSFSSRAQTMS